MTSPSSFDPAASSERLDRGLAAGYGPPAEPATSQGILAALAQRSGVSPQVLLRDAPEAGTPLLRPLPAAARERAAAGRYQFQGEIARGGMGVILKGHDQDLGRDVAIKVLHERYKDDASLLRRFVEEAQIGGQLQHPGIVPVYELGVHEGWPFFTMKLIKGRTLGALLAERTDPGQDRRRYLGIFELVCQTMAYAHARGVIHRDLKPANVMVGAFGEVQVVDWGMAKVLAQGGVPDERKERPSTIETVRSRAGTPPGTSSVAGAVMGTPSYMPPEQATGDVERMDERSDVFALGAILCEILTGAPPYAGGRDEVLAMAAQGALAAARGRLLQCEVDAELAALVTDCLALAPDERPRNAQALAARVSRYLASAEQRAQQARIEAAEARVNARTEQRARRLALSLATAVLALVILGGGGWLWLEGQATRRRHDTEQAVTRSLGDAALARGREDWAAARVALGRAQAHLEAGAPSAELRRQLDGVRIDIEREGEAAATRARMATDNLALLRAFEDVRQPENERSGEWARLDGDYRAIMVERGLDIDGTDQKAVAATLAARGIGIELGAAIDDWSLVRQKSGDAAGAMRLSSLAGALDPDPSRQELRAALVAGDTATLRRLAGADIVTMLPATTLRLLGAALGQAGMGEQALTILRAARLRFPRDFALAMRTGYQLLQDKLAAEADSHFGAALALRPESPEAWRALGRTLCAQRQLDRALEVLAFACRTWPDDAHMHFHRAEIWQQKGQIDEAIAALQRATQLAPESADAHCNLGRLLHERRDLEAALRHLRRAVDLAPNATALYNLGTALMDVPDLDGAIACLQKAAELAPALSTAHNNLGLALRSKDRLDEAVAAFHKAIAADPKSIPAHVNLGNTLRLKKDLTGAADSLRRALALDSRHASARTDLGLVLQDQHDLAGATACHRQAIDLDPGFAAAHFNLGNALYLQHDLDGAEQSFRAAIRIKDTNANYHRNLGVALKGKGDIDGAGACFRRAAQLGLTTPIVLHAAAWWLVARPGFEPADAREAVGYARKAAEQQRTGAVLHTLGVALYRAGDLQECVTIMEQAREAPESSPAVVALFLAMARHRLGQREAARQLFDSVAPIFAEGNVTEEPWRFRTEAAQVLGLGPSKVEATAPRSRPAESRAGGRR